MGIQSFPWLSATVGIASQIISVLQERHGGHNLPPSYGPSKSKTLIRQRNASTPFSHVAILSLIYIDKYSLTPPFIIRNPPIPTPDAQLETSFSIGDLSPASVQISIFRRWLKRARR